MSDIIRTICSSTVGAGKIAGVWRRSLLSLAIIFWFKVLFESM